MRIDGAAIFVDHLDRHDALAGGDGNGEARRHVLGDAEGWTSTGPVS